MTFVGKPFNHDVFVSYSHGDAAGTGDARLSQWSQSLIRELEQELRLDQEVRVFLDQSLQSGQALDPSMPVARALQNEIVASAIMLVLMSPHYARSDWCRQERVWWGETKDKHNLDPWSRVAFARLLPVENKLWPGEFVDDTGNPPVGHPFYNPAEEHPRPFDWPLVDNTSKEVRPALIKLAGELLRKLESVRTAVKEREKQVAAQAKLSATSGQLFYLYGRDAQAEDWGSVRDKLLDENFAVLPTEPEREPTINRDPKETARISEHRVATMSTCDAVLLLGSEDSSALAMDLAVIGWGDRQRAIARSSRPLPCGVLDTKGVVARWPQLPRQASNLGLKWLNAPINDLAAQIRGWLAGAPA